MHCIKIFIFIIFQNLSFVLVSQGLNTNFSIDSNVRDSVLDKTYNEAKFSVQTGNNIVQIGQVMSNSELYIRPAINYYHKSGINIGANLTTMPSDSQIFVDNFSFNIGYDKELNNDLSVGIDYSFSHYYSTKQVTSSAAHLIRPYISWENKYIMPTLTPSILIGTKVDYAFQLDFSHIFIVKSVFTPNDRLSIPISIGLNSGTSEHYNNYRIDRRRRALQPIDTTATTEFGLTSIYGMITAKYKIKKTSISFNTSYYITRDVYINRMISNPLVFKLTLAYYL